MLLGIPSKRGGRWAQVRDHGLPELRFRPGGLASQPACSLRPRLLNGARGSPGTLENHPGHSWAWKREDSGGKKPDSDLLIPPQRVRPARVISPTFDGQGEADGASLETLTGQAAARGEQLSHFSCCTQKPFSSCKCFWRGLLRPRQDSFPQLPLSWT